MAQKFNIHSMIKERKMKISVQVFTDHFLKVKLVALLLNQKEKLRKLKRRKLKA